MPSIILTPVVAPSVVRFPMLFNHSPQIFVIRNYNVSLHTSEPPIYISIDYFTNSCK